jgi:tetratricopeptide (TPR) repeat protein
MSRDNGQCLTDETLTEYLEGSLNPAIKTTSEVHLLGCEGCRDRLAVFMRLLQPEVTREEAQMLELVAARWESKTQSRRLQERKPPGGRWSVAVAALAAVFVLAVLSVWILRTRTEPKSATEVVQLLLKQSRPFESRIAGEPHHPIVRTRGSDDPGVSYDLLAGEMTRLSATSYEMGRFYLLQKNFGRAIPYLEMAALESAASAAVHNDLGVAYLESGDATQLQKAGQQFLHALQNAPSFADAAFNLALFYERTNAAAQAQTQWRRYLELDGKTEWADEARARLQGLSH